MSEPVKSLKKRKIGDSKSHSAAQPIVSSKSDTSASTSVTTAVVKKAKKPSRLWEDAQPKLSEPVLQTIRDLGFVKMTPVQAATIPLFMTNKDVAVQVCGVQY
jgi:superfamily II DNA/RNA helicase